MRKLCCDKQISIPLRAPSSFRSCNSPHLRVPTATRVECAPGACDTAFSRNWEACMRSQALIEFGSPLNEIESQVPEPKGTEVLLEVHHAGVCHSDVHIHDGYFDLGGGNKLPLKLPLPHTMGHEIEGRTIAAGPEAGDVRIGA